MLLEVLTVGVAALATAFVGTPMAVRLARAELPSFGGGSEPAARRSNRDVGVTAGFTPLDLGPDPMKWPSASSWPIANKLPPAEWPSKGWDDEHFGRHWKDGTTPEVADGGFHAMLERNTAAAAAAAPSPAKQRRSPPPAVPAQDPEAAFFDGAEAQKQQAIRRSQERAREQARRQQQEAMRQQALRQQQAQQRQRQAQQKAPPPRAQRKPTPPRPQPRAQAPKASTRPVAEGAPERAELEALVAEQGLAGTVQVIMRRTGWDFRQAAQYLARVRAGK